MLPLLALVAVVTAQRAGTQAQPLRAPRAPDLPLVIHPRMFRQAAQVGAVRAELAVSPLIPGTNRLALNLQEQERPLHGGTIVLTATMPGMAMRPLIYQARAMGQGRYLASGALSMFGRWRLTATIERPHSAPLRVAFTVPLGLPPSVLRTLAGGTGR